MENRTRFQGVPVDLAGKFIAVGATAPEFTLTTGELGEFKLADGSGKRLIVNIFPSIDTPVCSLSVRRFNEEAAQLDNTLVLCVSRDLPFAQSRFCAAEGIKNVLTLSDFRRESTFGFDYGVQIQSGPLRGLLARAVVVIDPNGRVIHAQLVDDIASEPDYAGALAALR